MVILAAYGHHVAFNLKHIPTLTLFLLPLFTLSTAEHTCHITPASYIPDAVEKMCQPDLHLLFCRMSSTCVLLHRDVRTSQGTFISRNEDKEGVLAWIEDRLAQLTGLPANHGEVRWFPSFHTSPLCLPASCAVTKPEANK